MRYLISTSIINNLPHQVWSSEIEELVQTGKATSRGVQIELTDHQCATVERMLNDYLHWLQAEFDTDTRTRSSLIFSAKRALDQLRHRAGNTSTSVPDGGTKWVCPECKRWVVTYVELLEPATCGKHTGRRVRMHPLTQA